MILEEAGVVVASEGDIGDGAGEGEIDLEPSAGFLVGEVGELFFDEEVIGSELVEAAGPAEAVGFDDSAFVRGLGDDYGCFPVGERGAALEPASAGISDA